MTTWFSRFSYRTNFSTFLIVPASTDLDAAKALPFFLAASSAAKKPAR